MKRKIVNRTTIRFDNEVGKMPAKIYSSTLANINRIIMKTVINVLAIFLPTILAFTCCEKESDPT